MVQILHGGLIASRFYHSATIVFSHHHYPAAQPYLKGLTHHASRITHHAAMCKSELNFSLEACRHRWYHMIQPCSPGYNLTTCPNKMALEGWEIKCDFCPFCAGWPLNTGEFLLLGSQPHSRSNSFSHPLSRRSSLATPVSIARRDSKKERLTTSESASSYISPQDGKSALGALAALGSPVYAASERNRAMNQRVDNYFVAVPENIIDTQQTRRTSSGWGSIGGWSPMAEGIAEHPVQDLRRGSGSTSSSQSQGSKVKAEKGSSAWKKAKRRSQDLTNFFR